MDDDHVAPLAFDAMLAGIAAEGARLRRTLADPGLARDEEVAACPGWSVGDVVVHLGEVQRSWAWRVARGSAAPPPGTPGLPPGPDPAAPLAELAAWSAEGTEALVAALAEAGPDAPCWSWWPTDVPGGHTAGAVARHQLHEAALHRWDVDDAGLSRDGTVDQPGFSAHQACDGIDELLRVTLAAEQAPWPVAEPGVLVLRALDEDGDVARAWTLDCTVAGAHPVVHDDGASMFTCRVSAPADDLQLLLWRRPREFRWRGESALFNAFLSWPSYD